MNCQETRTLLHAYADGELDLVKTLEVERHGSRSRRTSITTGQATGRPGPARPD